MNRSERGTTSARGVHPARIAGAIALLAIVAFFALRHSPYMHSVPGMPRWLGLWADHHGVSRNIVAFAALGLVCFALLGLRVWLLVTLAIFGTAVEVAQIWIPSRSFDVRDIGATLAGLLLAWAIGWCVARLKRQKN